jgi:hypothetical protein
MKKRRVVWRKIVGEKSHEFEWRKLASRLDDGAILESEEYEEDWRVEIRFSFKEMVVVADSILWTVVVVAAD